MTIYGSLADGVAYMFGWRRIRFVRDRLRVRTVGLLNRGQRELCVEVNDPALIGGAKEFLQFVVKYIRDSKRTILPGETLRYGYWLVKFVAASEETSQPLDVWEYNADATEFIPGGSLSIRYWVEQHKTCGRYNAIFAPPDPEALTAISTVFLRGGGCERCGIPGQTECPDGSS